MDNKPPQPSVILDANPLGKTYLFIPKGHQHYGGDELYYKLFDAALVVCTSVTLKHTHMKLELNFRTHPDNPHINTKDVDSESKLKYLEAYASQFEYSRKDMENMSFSRKAEKEKQEPKNEAKIGVMQLINQIEELKAKLNNKTSNFDAVCRLNDENKAIIKTLKAELETQKAKVTSHFQSRQRLVIENYELRSELEQAKEYADVKIRESNNMGEDLNRLIKENQELKLENQRLARYDRSSDKPKSPFASMEDAAFGEYIKDFWAKESEKTIQRGNEVHKIIEAIVEKLTKEGLPVNHAVDAIVENVNHLSFLQYSEQEREAVVLLLLERFIKEKKTPLSKLPKEKININPMEQKPKVMSAERFNDFKNQLSFVISRLLLTRAEASHKIASARLGIKEAVDEMQAIVRFIEKMPSDVFVKTNSTSFFVHTLEIEDAKTMFWNNISVIEEPTLLTKDEGLVLRDLTNSMDELLSLQDIFNMSAKDSKPELKSLIVEASMISKKIKNFNELTDSLLSKISDSIKSSEENKAKVYHVSSPEDLEKAIEDIHSIITNSIDKKTEEKSDTVKPEQNGATKEPVKEKSWTEKIVESEEEFKESFVTVTKKKNGIQVDAKGPRLELVGLLEFAKNHIFSSFD